jgi:hypothetical protein
MFPEFINLTHVYSYYQLETALSSAIRLDCPLLISETDQSAMRISLAHRNYVLVNTIVGFLIERPNKQSYQVLNPHLNKLNLMHLPNLGMLYEMAMIA